ncbi:MAG: hypothetical protein H3C34_21010 [Caldilineaceae bacterium]|nr:hypothetical protein [Caldilineaceae bacterium]
MLVSQNTANTSQVLATTSEGSAEVQRRNRRIRNAALGTIVLIFAAIGVIAGYRRVLKRHAIKNTAFYLSHWVKRLINNMGCWHVSVLDRAGVIWRRLNTPIVERARQAVVAGSIFLLAGAAVMWRWARTLDATNIQDASCWRIAFLGLGFAFAGLVMLISAYGFRRAVLSGARSTYIESKPGLWFGRQGAVMVGAISIVWFGLFQWLDVWNAHFDLHTWHYYAYTPMRLLFMLLLALALIGTGRLVLAIVRKQWGPMQLGPIESVVAAFFLGASTWYLILFVLGLLGLMTRYLVVPAFVVSISLSLPLFSAGLRRLRQGIQEGSAAIHLLEAILVCIPLGALFVLWLQVLVNRGLSVAGFEYDSSGHYLPYYRAVVENGGTAVNELWYHFWMTKGAGLHFVAVMLTDLQGPQLVSFLFLTMAVVTLVIAVRRMSGNLSLSFGAGVLFLAPFVHGFPYYQKLHIVTLAIVGGMLWLVTLAWRQGTLLRPAWLIPVTLLACAATLHTAPMAAILVPFLALTYGSFAFAYRHNQARNLYLRWAIPAGMVLITVLGVLVLNYSTAGVMELTPFRLFWNLANQTRFSNVISPYLMLFLDEGTSAATGNASLSSIEFSRLASLLQLSFMPSPLLYFAGFLLLAIAVIFGFDVKMRRIVLQNGILPTFLLLATAALVSLTVRQPGSIDRFYLFVLFPLVLFLVMLPADAVRRIATEAHPRELKSAMPQLILAFAITWACISSAGLWTSSYFFWNSPAALGAKVSFEFGKTSFRDAFLEPYISPQAAVWPRREISDACLAARAAVLADSQPYTEKVASSRVWTMTFLQEAGCHIMPGVEFMMEVSNRFGNQWHRIVLGNQDTAVGELKRIGVRHLFIDLGNRDETAKTGESTSVFGCLPYSPLLAPDSVRLNFTVKRVHGDAFLLSLKDIAREEEVPPVFTQKFAQKTAAHQLGIGDMPGICSRLRDYYAKWGEQWPVRSDPSLPKLQGWQ